MTTLSAPIIFRSFIALMMEMFSPIVSSHKAVWSESKSSRDIILRKIEFVCLDLVRQLSVVPSPSRLVLRASEDDAQKQIVIQSRQSLRLAYIIQCLAQIYRLILNNQQSSKRDLYYEQKKLYKGQQNLDRAITTICDLLNEPRISLNIISSSKGILFGALAFMTKEEKLIDCRCQPVLITEALRDFRIISGAQFIIVVEKDAVFQKLIDEGYFNYFPKSLLVTGKGYPDICTRKVLQWIVEQLAVPIYGLFDSDPHGIEIMLTYKYGSNSDRVEGQRCYVRQIQWLGLKPSDVPLLPVVNHHFLRLRNRDFMKIRRIRQRAQALGEHNVVEELDKLHLLRSKIELEALSTIAPQFIICFYLMPRLATLLGESFVSTTPPLHRPELHRSESRLSCDRVES